MPIIIPQRFSQRYDTVANWTAKNPVLWSGEIAYGTDGTGKVVSTKVGDGTTSWTGLPEAGGGGVPSGGTTGQIIVKQSATDGDADWQDPLIQSAGTGIDITSGVISSTLGSIALSGYPATYSALPSGLGSGDAGKAYMVKADELVYVWDGSAWPAQGSGIYVGRVGPGDPQWRHVASLLHFDSTWVDERRVSWWAQTGTPVISGTQSVFGTKSLYLDGSSVLVTSHAAMFPCQEFCIEARIYVTSLATDRGICFVGTQGQDATRVQFYVTSTGALSLFLSNSGTQITWPTSAVSLITTNKWYSVAGQVQGGTASVWIDGALVASAASATQSLAISTLQLGAVRTGSTERRWLGYIDEFRFTNGVGRYSSTYTPASQPFPNFGE